MDKLYIVMPAYNEEDNIKQVIDAWYPIVEKLGKSSRLVIVDDGSKDNTYKLMKEYAENHPLFIALTKKNEGHGATVLYAYRYAIEQGADFIFQTDSDGQTNPDEFEAFWRNRNKYDAILGNRVVRGDGKARKFVEMIVCLLLRLIFTVKVPDANAPFRLMRADKVEKYINKMPVDFNLPNIMLTTYFVYFGDKVKFRRISFVPRQAGISSINIKNITKIGWRALKDFIKLRKSMK